MPSADNAPSSPGDPASALRSALGQSPGATIDAASAMDLAAMLAEFAASLDQVVWSTWKIVAPNSPLKRSSPARVSMSRYVAGEPGATREQVKQDLERLRQLTAALTAAVGQTGRVFAQKHVEKFAPGEIEHMAKASAGSVLVGHEVKCWRKYVELAGPQDAQAIEREILGAMAGYAESLLKGLSK